VHEGPGPLIGRHFWHTQPRTPYDGRLSTKHSVCVVEDRLSFLANSIMTSQQVASGSGSENSKVQSLVTSTSVASTS